MRRGYSSSSRTVADMVAAATDEADWSGYRIVVERDGLLLERWKVSVSHKVSRPDPQPPVAEVRDRSGRWRRETPPGPEPLDLTDVVLDVGHAWALTRAGAHRAGDRIVNRDLRARRRRLEAEVRVVGE